MKIAAITSMNLEYYNKCGKALLESYNLYWKDLCPLYVYNEDNFQPLEPNILLMGWNLGQDYDDFQLRHKNKRIKIFSKKAFSIIHAMENIDCDRLIWIDADIIIKETLDKDILKEITNKKYLSSHFSVWHKKDETNFHSCETGFFVLNKNHKGFSNFLSTYKDIYINDVDHDLRRFYDGEVYGKTVEKMSDAGYEMLNLTKHTSHKTPIKRSILNPYISHFKAGMKEKLTDDVIAEYIKSAN